MTQIADDLLAITLIRQGRLRLDRRVVELASVVEAAIDVVDAAMIDGPRMLEVTKMAEPVYVFADRARLQQIITKLLLNAIMNTGAMGHIRLEMQVDGEHVEITVADNGAGIAPNDLPYLFDMHSSARRPDEEKPGVGLGLPLVRALVDIHGGTVMAASEGLDKGSLFKVRLPIASAERLRDLKMLH